MFYLIPTSNPDTTRLRPHRKFQHTKVGLVLIFSIFSLPYCSSYIYAAAIEEYTAKAALTVNLARFTDWPHEIFQNNTTTINLCILGDEVIQQAFTLIEKKQVGNKTLVVRNINTSKQLSDCHLLFVGTDNTIPNWVDLSHSKHILTIGDTDGFLNQGGMVYLEMTDAKINLHINVNALKSAGIWINARVLKLAIIFNP